MPPDKTPPPKRGLARAVVVRPLHPERCTQCDSGPVPRPIRDNARQTLPPPGCCRCPNGDWPGLLSFDLSTQNDVRNATAGLSPGLYATTPDKPCHPPAVGTPQASVVCYATAQGRDPSFPSHKRRSCVWCLAPFARILRLVPGTILRFVIQTAVNQVTLSRGETPSS